MTQDSKAGIPPLQLTVAGVSRDQLVAASAGWLAVLLNLGCQGMGYAYQRRWGAYWLGALAASAAAVVGGGGAAIVTYSLTEGQQERSEMTGAAAMVGIYSGVIGAGIGSALEAGLAVNRARRRLQS